MNTVDLSQILDDCENDDLELRIQRAKHSFLQKGISPEERRARWDVYRDLILSRNAEHRRAKERKLFGRTFG